MKNFLFLSLLFILLTSIVFVLFSESRVSIGWLDWNIEIDAFFLLLGWSLSYVILSVVISIYKTPRKIKFIIQKRKIDKSTSHFNRALLHYLNEDFEDSAENFALIKEKESYFEAQLMSAAALMKSGEINKTTSIIRKLIRQYPKQASFMQCLLSKWQLQVGEYHLAYETLASEIKGDSTNNEKWFLFIKATEYTNRLDEWKLLLPRAKKELSRQDFKKLNHKLHELQVKYAETSAQLKHIWENIDSSARQNPYIIKAYLDRRNQLEVHAEDDLSYIKQVLKNEWRSEWLWDMVNYQEFKEFHNLLDWSKNTVKQNHHLEDCTYYLSLAVIACRAQLWAISEDYLIQANKSLNKKTQDQIIITLIKGLINFKIEEKEVSPQWSKLMKQYDMNWVETIN